VAERRAEERPRSVDVSGETLERVTANVARVVHAPAEILRLAVLSLVSEGHLIIEDFPGVGKTMLAKALARSLDCSFSRIQFTPDLLPSDVTGVNVFDQRTNEFEFRPGPVFANLLLVDEINRASPKTQAALLECMQENQVTVDGVSYPLERPFMVLATQNPIEYEGTYPLPEAQLDRFLVRIAIGYPSEDAERDILLERSRRRRERIELEPVCDRQSLRAMQAAIEEVHVAPPLAEYAVAIARATRDSPQLAVGASPRGSLALMKLARARAAYLGRDFVTPDDIKAVSIPALAHRLTLAPEFWVQRIDPAEAVRAAVASVPVPVLDESS
jgi:MoxR-like ATPase